MDDTQQIQAAVLSELSDADIGFVRLRRRLVSKNPTFSQREVFRAVATLLDSDRVQYTPDGTLSKIVSSKP